MWQICNKKELEMAMSLADQAEAYQKLYRLWKFELDQGLVQHETKHLDQLEIVLQLKRCRSETGS